ncbi:MAG: hypothetical protein KAY59_04865 [Acidobacteria bacterium]|nr:hypothetical protein [Acidobacteriota bacterium]
MTKMLTSQMRRGALVLGCVAAVALVAGRPMVATLMAQDALPKASELLAKSVAAMGGADAVKAIKSIRAKGTFEMPAQGMTGTFEMIQARPSLSKLTIEIGGVGSIEQGSDGKNAWTIDPMSGPSLLTGKALADAKGEAMFDAQLFGPDFVKSATTLEKTKFGDRAAYKIKLVTVFDSERTMYVDAETYFVIGSESVQESPMGPMPSTGSTGDYKKFGALMQPTTIVQSAMGFDQIVRVTSYEYDVVPMSAFEPPAAIKALIK